MDEARAYPLKWPDGWPRTPASRRDDGRRFKTMYGFGGARKTLPTFDRARRLLREELVRLKATNIVLSTNVPLRNDGEPYAGAVSRSMDQGVAIYFTLKGRQMVMAQDAYSAIEANLRSLALAIDAMRSLERHGGGTMMHRAFEGFAALPAPDGMKPKRPWWIVLNYGEDTEARADLSTDEIQARFRTLAKRRHPDIDGGSAEAMAELVEAKDQAVRELGG